jgi:microcystin-dependent protein
MKEFGSHHDQNTMKTIKPKFGIPAIASMHIKLLFVFAMLLCLEAPAFDVLLTDDTALILNRKSANYGARPTLPVATNYNALFKFDLDSVPPGTTADKVSVATLTVFINRVTRPGAISLFMVNGAWSERAVPAVTFTALPSSPAALVPIAGKNTFVRFDVTDLVRSWLSGMTNAGIAIGADASGSNVSLVLDSKENTAGGHCAKLDIEFGLASPPGSVMAYMGTTAPIGWLLCDGSAVSRTNYPALWAAIGTNSGAGDSSTTFNLPDMRGIFLRGVNGSRSDAFADPDAVSLRTSIFSGGNTGNAVGSYQADQFASHEHAQFITANPGWGAGIRLDYDGDAANLGAYPQGINTGSAGGNETRPKNVYVNYIIKY